MPALLCLLLASAPLAADDSSFRKLDRDRDGQLSAREVAPLRLDFHGLDTNNNGYLSRNELGRAAKSTSRRTSNRNESHRSTADNPARRK